MATDYDPISELYQQSKLTPWRTHIESHTLLNLIGDVQGRSVLDVACGEGFYTRLLKLHGAGHVCGVDLSAGMIELAQKQESARPLGIEYQVGDGRRLGFGPVYDLAVSAYLLNYATCRQELLEMATGIARCLKPGGRYVTVNCNPFRDFRSAPSYRKYGFDTSARDPWGEGAPITWTFFLDENTEFSIENYFLSPETHDEVFREAGFREVHWHPATVSDRGEQESGAEFWSSFLEASPIAFIECRV